MEGHIKPELTVAQEKCIEMLLEGYQIKDIEKEIGYSRKTIWDWRRGNRLFIAAMDERKREISEFLQNSAKKRFEKLQDNAINVLAELLKDSKNDNVRMETAKEILNRNIGKIPSKITVSETDNIEDDISIIDDIDEWDEEKTEE
jgi:transposase